MLVEPIHPIPQGAAKPTYHYTDRLRHTLVRSKQQAHDRGDASVCPEHLFLSMGHSDCVKSLVQAAGHTLDDLENQFQSNPIVSQPVGDEPPYSHQTVSVFEQAQGFAVSLNHNFLGNEHLLWALVSVDSPVALFLRDQGLTSKEIRRQIFQLLGLGITR